MFYEGTQIVIKLLFNVLYKNSQIEHLPRIFTAHFEDRRMFVFVSDIHPQRHIAFIYLAS